MAARTWDQTVDNVWHRLEACDHLLDLKSRKKGDPPPVQGISYASVTRHLRILCRRLEEVMGKSARLMDHPGETFQRNSGTSCGQGKRPSRNTENPCIGVIFCHSKLIVGQAPRLYNLPSEYMLQGHRYLDPPILGVQRRLRDKSRHPDSQNPHL